MGPLSGGPLRGFRGGDTEGKLEDAQRAKKRKVLHRVGQSEISLSVIWLDAEGSLELLGVDNRRGGLKQWCNSCGLHASNFGSWDCKINAFEWAISSREGAVDVSSPAPNLLHMGKFGGTIPRLPA